MYISRLRNGIATHSSHFSEGAVGLINVLLTCDNKQV
tara:strand:- start:3988 stop:4098 length:111 start_codon:yes stop_codon:yes gene_type:complete